MSVLFNMHTWPNRRSPNLLLTDFVTLAMVKIRTAERVCAKLVGPKSRCEKNPRSYARSREGLKRAAVGTTLLALTERGALSSTCGPGRGGHPCQLVVNRLTVPFLRTSCGYHWYKSHATTLKKVVFVATDTKAVYQMLKAIIPFIFPPGASSARRRSVAPACKSLVSWC